MASGPAAPGGRAKRSVKPGAGPQDVDPGAVARQHDQQMMDSQRRYVRGDDMPAVPAATIGSTTDAQPMPMSYAFPTEQASRFEFEQGLKQTQALGPDTQWFANPQQVDFLYDAYKRRQLKDFDEWFGRTVDLRKPAQFAWAAGINPGYIQRQLEQLDRELALQKKNAVVKTFGANTPEDLMFKYMQDTGQLRDERAESDTYVRGLFRPVRRSAQWSPWDNMFARGGTFPNPRNAQGFLGGADRTNFGGGAGAPLPLGGAGAPATAQGSVMPPQ